MFYRLLLDHLAEMMPIVYTPTVGLACEQFSHIYRRPRGLFIAYPERDHIEEILENAASPQVEVIVVTDGERILGLGDQGVGGMGIPIGKLSLYTACGGIHPATTLPITLDVGTNNRERLDDPLYIGWRHERISGPDYDAFIEMFVTAVAAKFPRVLLQWEDFAQQHAGLILDRYRDRLCSFNDDIQGTGAVAAGTLLAAVAVSGGRLRDQRVVILGAGSAGCGIAEQLVVFMVSEGLTERQARDRFYLLNRKGVLHDELSGLQAVSAEIRSAPRAHRELGHGSGWNHQLARRCAAGAADDPDRRIGPGGGVHGRGGARDGPACGPAHYLPPLEPDLSSRGDAGRPDLLD